MSEEGPVGRDVRFCPYCFQETFDMREVSGEWVFCEICGVDVDVKDLVKQ
jgi:hypothetical protein